MPASVPTHAYVRSPSRYPIRVRRATCLGSLRCAAARSSSVRPGAVGAPSVLVLAFRCVGAGAAGAVVGGGVGADGAVGDGVVAGAGVPGTTVPVGVGVGAGVGATSSSTSSSTSNSSATNSITMVNESTNCT